MSRECFGERHDMCLSDSQVAAERNHEVHESGHLGDDGGRLLCLEVHLVWIG